MTRLTAAGPTPLAERALRIEPFRVMALLERAKQLEAAGRDVVHMEVGEPDFPTPTPIVEAGQRALRCGRVRYTPAAGLPELRQRISAYYERRYGTVIDWSRVIVTPGGSGALILSLAALIDPGDRVLMADPGYPCNRQMVRLLGGVPLCIPAGPEHRYQLTAELAEAAWEPGIRVVMVASPSNPTGTLLDRAEIDRLYRLVRSRGAVLLVDEIYQGLVFDAEDCTALSVAEERLFVVNSFSKYFGMTGWRLGWVVAPWDSAAVLERLAQNLYLAPATISQCAAMAAFGAETSAILEARRGELRRRRDYLLGALSAIGFDFDVSPEGAFYLYGRCDRFGPSARVMANDLLERAAVAVTPGCDFGLRDADKYLRFAYTCDVSRLEQGVARIRDFFET